MSTLDHTLRHAHALADELGVTPAGRRAVARISRVAAANSAGTPSVAVPGAAGAAGTSPAPQPCVKCGEPVIRHRVRAGHDLSVCLRCEQKARASSYFQLYYTSHRDRILEKNRRWAKKNAQSLAERRRVRAQQRDEDARQCVDCGTPVARAERCRRCHIRHRYANDPQYREHRLAITRRWLDKQK